MAATTPQTCPASYTCPENDGCTFQSADSRTFALYCGTDFYGGDLNSMSAASLDDCNQACANNAQCVAASFVGGKGAGQCYLKNENDGAVANSNVDGQFRVQFHSNQYLLTRSRYRSRYSFSDLNGLLINSGLDQRCLCHLKSGCLVDIIGPCDLFVCRQSFYCAFVKRLEFHVIHYIQHGLEHLISCIKLHA